MSSLSALESRIDDVGIGILASPYLAQLAAKHGPEAVAAPAEKYDEWFQDSPAAEVAGLALVAPGVTSRLARVAQKVAFDRGWDSVMTRLGR